MWCQAYHTLMPMLVKKMYSLAKNTRSTKKCILTLPFGFVEWGYLLVLSLTGACGFADDVRVVPCAWSCRVSG